MGVVSGESDKTKRQSCKRKSLAEECNNMDNSTSWDEILGKIDEVADEFGNLKSKIARLVKALNSVQDMLVPNMFDKIFKMEKELDIVKSTVHRLRRREAALQNAFS